MASLCTISFSVCVLDTCVFEKQAGYKPGRTIGFIEKDGIAGASRDDELVMLGEAIENGVTLIADCNEW